MEKQRPEKMDRSLQGHSDRSQLMDGAATHDLGGGTTCIQGQVLLLRYLHEQKRDPGNR